MSDRDMVFVSYSHLDALWLAKPLLSLKAFRCTRHWCRAQAAPHPVDTAGTGRRVGSRSGLPADGRGLQPGVVQHRGPRRTRAELKAVIEREWLRALKGVAGLPGPDAPAP